MSRIEDYAMLGDCRTAALVGRDGSVDWLCLPRFDSAACFAKLVGVAENGRWLLAPEGPSSVTRRYVEGTLVLETNFRTPEGEVTVVDFMSPRDRTSDLIRIVVGKTGRVPMRTELLLRFDYGWIVPWVRRIDGGIRAVAGPDCVELRTPVPLRGENLHTVGEFVVSAGERIPFVLTWQPSWEPRHGLLDPERKLKSTIAWWRAWASQASYEGEWAEPVLRSLIVLKALSDDSTGGIVAAPTTSLPEAIGGVRNWDYRLSWLRDATFTLYALMNGGFFAEARAWREWLLHAVAGDPSKLQILYGIGGQRRVDERTLPWLSGYEGSGPVRIGNAASGQRQLDVYGEVMDMLFECRRWGLEPDEYAWHVQEHLTNFLETAWRESDSGIWEMRGEPAHFVHSKVMAWVAFDRALKSCATFGLQGPMERWQRAKDAIAEEVCRRGFDAEIGAFVQTYGSKHVDASALLIPLVGFLPGDDPRVLGTVAAVEKRLLRDGLVYRYLNDVDGLPPGEGAFLACSFWLADNYVLQGRYEDARALFSRLVALRNDVGLLSEEIDPTSGRMLGNFPQAFSHVALVNSATNLARHNRAPASRRST